MKHIETFTTNKINKDIKIALLSDIHYHDRFSTRLLNKLTKQIKNSQPDYICLVGDIVDQVKYKKLDKLITFLSNISTIAPIICVLGNHDEKSGSLWTWKHEPNKHLIEALNSIKNLHLLEDATYQDGNLVFYGFNFSFNYYENCKESYEEFNYEANELKTKLNKSNYNIVLFHSPINIYDFIKNNPNHELAKSDLIFSGHMHNGILPFWLSYPLNKIFKTNRSIISPQKKLFPKYSQGRVYGKPEGYIFEAITKLSRSTGFYHLFNIFFFKNIEIIEIKRSNN